MAAAHRIAPVAIVAFCLALPLAGAHDDPTATGYDPLTFSAEAWPTTDRALSFFPPLDGLLYFPESNAVAGGAPPVSELVFGLRAPVAFTLGHGLDVTLQLVADKPVPTRDANGNAFELSILLEGAPVADSTKRVALSTPVMAPGDKATVHAILQAPAAAFAKDAKIALRVTALTPAMPADALKVLIGPSKATFDSMRVPSVKDLELEDGDLQVFLPRAESFKPSDPSAVVVTARVGHASFDLPATRVPDGKRAFLVLLGDEPVADARVGHDFPDRERRVNATHQFSVDGRLVRVHPGVGVVVPLGAGPAPILVACVKNCPSSPPTMISFDAPSLPADGATVARASDSALIPPPPPTSGIPVSKDAPAATERSTPAGGLAFVLACVALAVILPKSRP